MESFTGIRPPFGHFESGAAKTEVPGPKSRGDHCESDYHEISLCVRLKRRSDFVASGILGFPYS
jgi:hypothetical protein